MSSSVSQNKSNKMAKKSETVVAPAPAVVAAAPKVARKAAPAAATVVVPTTVPTTVPDAAPVEVRSADVILSTLQETLRALATETSTRLRAAVHDAARGPRLQAPPQG